MTARRRRRITVSGAAELILQPDETALCKSAPPGPGEVVAPLGGAVRPGQARAYEVLVGGWRFEVLVEPARLAQLRERAARAAAAAHPTSTVAVRAQLPGRIVRLWVTAGEDVAAGARLLGLEAMKMENEVRAPRAGRVAALKVALGDRVEHGDELLTLE